VNDERAETPTEEVADRATQRRLLTDYSFSAPRERVLRRSDHSSAVPVSREDSDPDAPAPGGYQAVRSALHLRLLAEMERAGILDSGEERVKTFVRDFVRRVLAEEELPLNELERRTLPDDLAQETFGVGPLAPLMLDPAVSDILVNGPHTVYVERYGLLEKTAVRFRDAEHLMRIIQRIAAMVGRRVDESSPMMDARLPDGSRVNATVPPVSIDGPVLSIRRFGRLRMLSRDLVRLGMLSEPMLDLLRAAVKARQSILISGGAGAGKSTLLGALAEAIPDGERIVTIEDAAELRLAQKHVVRLETRIPNIEGRGRIAMRELVINSLRMRPDRIIVGEVRGGEALDMLQAMNTGHDGSLTTIHANSPKDALARLETMVLMSGMELPSRAIREQLVSAIRFVVHVRRHEDGIRRVESISEILGLEDGTPSVQDIYRHVRKGYRNGRVDGEYRAAGNVPAVLPLLAQADDRLVPQAFANPENGTCCR